MTLGPLTNLAIAILVEPALPRLLRRWVCMGGAFRVPGNTTPVSASGTSTATPRRRGSPSRHGRRRSTRDADRPAGARARPRRHGAGAARRPTTWSRWPDGRAAGPTTRSIPAVTRRAGAPIRRQQPGDPVPRRRPPLLLRVPRPLRRVLRRLHPRPAGGRGGARSGPRQDRAGGRRGRRVRRRGRRPDDRRLAAHDAAGRRTRTSRSRSTPPSSGAGSSSGSGALAASRA